MNYLRIRGEIIYKIMMIKDYNLSMISWHGHFVKSDQMSGGKNVSFINLWTITT